MITISSLNSHSPLSGWLNKNCHQLTNFAANFQWHTLMCSGCYVSCPQQLVKRREIIDKATEFKALPQCSIPVTVRLASVWTYPLKEKQLFWSSPYTDQEFWLICLRKSTNVKPKSVFIFLNGEKAGSNIINANIIDTILWKKNEKRDYITWGQTSVLLLVLCSSRKHTKHLLPLQFTPCCCSTLPF